MNVHRLILLTSLLLVLTACEERDYHAGYRAGEKAGHESGHQLGYLSGYKDGTCKVVGDDWLPSLGHGICLGLCLATASIVIRLLWDSLIGLTFGARRLSVRLQEAFSAWRLQRTFDAQLHRQRQRERAEADASARILAARLLRQANASLDEEQMRLAVEQFMREAWIVPEMQARIEVGMAACEGALGFIEKDRLLTPVQKKNLLRHLAGVIQPCGAANA